jgi:hypothetical protein
VRPALLLLLLTAPAADPPARARAELSPKDEAWVGQRVTLAVTLATPDLFAGAPSFALPDIPGAVVLPPAGSPVIGSETVGDVTYTTQRHEFAVFAERPGVVRIPAFHVRFESNAGFGKPTVRREVTIDDLSFTARTPPGAEGLGTVIAARDLQVTTTWDPEPNNAKVGDAFTNTVTVTAAGVPGMVFPPLRFGAIDGLAAYPKPPAVNDRTERGALTGQRAEAVTYVCERPGAVTIPDRSLTWWDLDAKELKTVKLPGRSFEVAPDPKAPSDPAPGPTATPKAGSGWLWALPAAGAALVAGWLWHTRGRPWWARYRQSRAESAPAAFARFRRACRSADPHAAYAALLGWLDRFGPMSLDEFTARAGDPELAGVVADLIARVYARPGATDRGPWAAADLAARAAAARQRLQSHERRRGPVEALPPLNPPA